MKADTQNTIITICLGVVILTLIGQCLSMRQENQNLANRLASAQILLQRIPTIEDIQEKIGAKPDGKLCPQWNDPNHSETQQCWERALGNQYADKYFHTEEIK